MKALSTLLALVSLSVVAGCEAPKLGPSNLGTQVINVYQVETTHPWPVKMADGNFEKTYGSFWATIDAGHVGAERQHIACGFHGCPTLGAHGPYEGEMMDSYLISKDYLQAK